MIHIVTGSFFPDKMNMKTKISIPEKALLIEISVPKYSGLTTEA